MFPRSPPSSPPRNPLGYSCTAHLQPLPSANPSLKAQRGFTFIDTSPASSSTSANGFPRRLRKTANPSRELVRVPRIPSIRLLLLWLLWLRTEPELRRSVHDQYRRQVQEIHQEGDCLLRVRRREPVFSSRGASLPAVLRVVAVLGIDEAENQIVLPKLSEFCRLWVRGRCLFAAWRW